MQYSRCVWGLFRSQPSRLLRIRADSLRMVATTIVRMADGIATEARMLARRFPRLDPGMCTIPTVPLLEPPELRLSGEDNQAMERTLIVIGMGSAANRSGLGR